MPTPPAPCPLITLPQNGNSKAIKAQAALSKTLASIIETLKRTGGVVRTAADAPAMCASLGSVWKDLTANAALKDVKAALVEVCKNYRCNDATYNPKVFTCA